MVFSSPIFIFLFLPFVLAVYFLLPDIRWRNLFLLVMSVLFYAFGEVWYTFVVLFSIVFNYLCGLWLSRTLGSRQSGAILALAVAVNLGLLGVFKYANLVVDTLNPALAGLRLPAIALAPVHLPIGISFFTFHALSYVIDIYRGNAKAQRGLLHSALYITVFPQLIAGPIVRYKDIATQFAERTVDRPGFALGVRRFLIGLTKKMLIANSVGITADAIYALPPAQLTTSLAWLAAVCYTFQLYFDFSGYSDMAIGLARMFGFRFPENFNHPYISQSVTEFWSRWHMSLSTWFRDYLYIPLGGSRKGELRTYFNLFVVFLLCGLWHGASWTFVFWGMYYGVFLVVERLGLGQWIAALWRPLRHAYTMLVVLVGWVFFRADTLQHAWRIIQALAGFAPAADVTNELGMYLTPGLAFILLVALVASWPVLETWGEWRRWLAARAGTWARFTSGALDVGETAALASLMLVSFIRVAADTHNPFIYFRF